MGAAAVVAGAGAGNCVVPSPLCLPTSVSGQCVGASGHGSECGPGMATVQEHPSRGVLFTPKRLTLN